MISYDVLHRSSYRYGATISSAHLLVALAPRVSADQQLLDFSLHCIPEPSFRAESLDANGNVITHLTIASPHDSLEVVSRSRVQITVDAPPWRAFGPWRDAVAALDDDRTPQGLEGRDFRLPTKHVPLSRDLADYARKSFDGHPLIGDALADLSARIFEEFVFDPGFSDVATPLADVLEHRRGVCQDFAHLYIGCARAMGLAARYVSGYIETEPPPGEAKQQGADASHAWCSVLVPSVGWVDVDPTNNATPPRRHVTIGWGRDYGDIAPIRGVLVGPPATQQIDVAVDVQRHSWE